MENGKTDLQTSNSKQGEKNAPKVYFEGYFRNVPLKDTFRKKDGKTSSYEWPFPLICFEGPSNLARQTL